MLRAVLEILYAGVGVCRKDETKVKDPKVEDLSMVSIDFWLWAKCLVSHMLMTFFKLLFLTNGNKAAVTF